MALMTTHATAAWRQYFDTAKKILAAHAAANKLIFIDGPDIKLCSPVLSATDFAACEIKVFA